MTRYRSPPHRHGAVAAAALAALLAGCAAPAPALKAWRVEPNYRITNTGPSAGPGYVALAKQYEGERRWRDASEAWRKASLEAPVDAEILNSLGTAEAGQGRYREAIAALRRAVALAPERAQLLNNLGFALLLDGLAAEATAVFRDALVRDPTHRLARANLERAEQSALASAPSSTGPTAAAPTNHMSDPARLSALGLGAQSVAAPARTAAEAPVATLAPAVAAPPSQPADARLQTVANVAALQVSGASAGASAGAQAAPQATVASNQATSPLEVAALSAPPAQPQQQPRRELPSPVPVPSQPTPTPMQAPTSTYLVGFTPAARAEAPPPQTVVAPVQLPAAPAASEPLVDTRPAVVAPAPEPTPVPALNVPTKPATANVPARAPAATRAPAVAGTAVLTLTADRPDQNRPQPQPRVEIANGNGVVGMAAKLSGFLRSRGVVQHAALSNLAPFNTTASVVYYRPGFAAAAKALADRAPYRIEVAAAPGGTTSNADLRVVLGRDVRLAAACERNCVIAGAPAPLPAAVDAGADVGADVRADAGAVSGFASGDATSAPDRPSPLVAAWLAVLAR